MNRQYLIVAALVLWLTSLAGGQVKLFHPDQALESYMKTPPLAQAMELLGRGSLDKAVDLLRAQQASLPEGPERRAVEFHLARALMGSGQAEEAAQIYLGLAPRYPVMADDCRLEAARAYQAAGKADQALLALAGVDQKGPLAVEASLFRALAQAMLRQKEAVESLALFLRKNPHHDKAPLAQQTLALLLQNLGRKGEAAVAYRHLWTKYPLSPQGKDGEDRWRDLARSLPKDQRKQAEEVPPQELVDRAEALARGGSLTSAVAALREALDHLPPKGATTCRLWFRLGKTLQGTRRHAEAAQALRQAVNVCQDQDLAVQSRYYAARSLTQLDMFKESFKLYWEIIKLYPKHSYADDAWLRIARLYSYKNDTNRFRSEIDRLIKKYPKGDKAPDAAFALVMEDLLHSRWEKALEKLERLPQDLQRDALYWEGGRVPYWRGRAAQVLGQGDLARRSFGECIERHPLSYYTLLSFSRLTELDQGEAKRLAAKWAGEMEKAEEGWAFAWRPEMDKPAFGRAMELLRLGLGAEARSAFVKLGLSRPSDPEGQWLLTVLLDRAGLYPLSHDIPRRQMKDWHSHWPLGPQRKQWLVAYPQAFAKEIKDKAKAGGVPQALAWAIMREESGFSPTIRSRAGATGLAQIMPTTASREAKRLGLPFQQDQLLDPSINLRLGMSFLGRLVKDNQGDLPLAVAAYNAGQGAVNRWIKQRGRKNLDLFVEAIPYDETRGYTRRVIATYGVYTFLYQRGLIPPLSVP